MGDRSDPSHDYLERLAAVVDEPKAPFFERDLRRARMRLIRRRIRRAGAAFWNGPAARARHRLADFLGRVAGWVRREPNSA